MPSDETTLIVMHAALGMICLVAFLAEWAARLRAGRGSLSLVVGRGTESMGVLTGVFATSLGLFAVAIEVSEAAVGHKSFLVAIDFALLAHLFLFNSWFRNKVIGEASESRKEAR